MDLQNNHGSYLTPGPHLTLHAMHPLSPQYMIANLYNNSLTVDPYHMKNMVRLGYFQKSKHIIIRNHSQT